MLFRMKWTLMLQFTKKWNWKFSWGLQKAWWFSAVYYRIWLEGYIKLYLLESFHLLRANKLSKFNQSIFTVKINQDVNEKKICRYGTQYYPKPLIFMVIKQKQLFYRNKTWKNNCGSYLSLYKCFFHLEILANNTIKKWNREKIQKFAWNKLVKCSSEFLAYLGRTGTQPVFKIVA